MWDKDEDDLDQMNQEDEKFEDNSKMAGEKLDDEMRTKEDQDNEQGSDEGDKAKQDTEKHNSNQDAPDESTDNNKDETENINDDTEDKYEDSHGYEVRDEQNTADNNDEQDLDIDLNEGMDIDEDYDANDQGDDNTSLSEEMDDAHDPDAMDENDNDDDGEDDPEEVEEAEGIDVAGQGGNIENSENSKDEKPDDGEEGSDEPNMEHAAKNQIESKEQLHGIAAPDGEDAVKENYVEDQVDEAKDDGNAIDDAGGADENMGESSQGSGGNGNDGSWQSRQAKEQEKGLANTELDEIPNPLRSPGDAEKFWHKKLDIINDSPEHEDSTPRDTIGEEPQQEKARQDGVFEYSKENEDSNGQVLGAAEEEQAKQLQEIDNDEFQSKEEKDSADTEMDYRNEQSKRDKCKQSQSESNQNPTTEEQSKSQQENVSDQVEEKQNNDELQEGDQSMNHDNERPILDDVPITSNRIPSEVSDLEDLDESNDDIQEVEVSMEMSALDVQEARLYWQTIQAETNNLSRRLCEKLRLVMEPLVATKLRGDYRTGKRVNMKRIIGYIASGYRKDKIWLRRTKPAKRDYRVLIAVDDSESMQKSQAGDMGLRALSTLANGMSQLEIGQLGVASFGEEMKLIHQFNLPFTSESGVNVVSNFTFSQKRTRTALCVESAISALKSVESTSSSMQLVFMISDGRIERDSRSKLRRLIRQMSEENMLLVMIIVEGEDSNNPSNKVKESILNMKEVSFVKGKPQIKHFIEDYPFPYYLVVNDLTALPEILGDALKQWFEMMTQIQNGI
jgi:midasin